jgi:hypothetical protein
MASYSLEPGVRRLEWESLVECGIYYRNNVLHMRAAREFGHYAAVLFMHGLIGDEIG